MRSFRFALAMLMDNGHVRLRDQRKKMEKKVPLSSLPEEQRVTQLLPLNKIEDAFKSMKNVDFLRW